MQQSIYQLTDNGLQTAWQLFDGTEETLIWSALQGIMGQVSGDDPDQPSAVRTTTGDFAFFAGNPDAPGAEALIRTVTVPLLGCGDRQTDKWKQRILSIWPDAQIFDRYTIEKNTRFDRERLEKYADRLPDGFTVIPISRDWYGHCLEEDWTQDFVSNFPSAEDFVRYGVGFLVLDPSGRPAAGASSYSVYRGGIEIEVDTNENYRRRGLALAVCARLILTCLEKGLYPSWDAANLASVSLAQKLGYTPGHHYEVFYLSQKDPQQTATGQVVFNGNR